MATLTAIREGFKTRFLTIPGLSASALSPGQINTPAAWVTPDGYEWLSIDRSARKWRFRLHCAVQLQDFELAQNNLDPYVSSTHANSIEAAVFGDDTLGGIIGGITRFDMTGYGRIEVGGAEYLAAIWDLEAIDV